jgi:lipoprotein-releasing system ATP-binding protein
LLVVESLSKSYRSGNEIQTVFSDISLSLAPGELLALHGASGSGKSTLLNLIAGLDSADSGSVTLNGYKISFGNRDLTRFRNKNLGFVYQFHHLLRDLTALENVMLPLIMSRLDSKTALLRAQDMLERVSLAHIGSRRVTDLSGGEQQRVAIARAIVNRPALVLADEPTGNLDFESAEICTRLLTTIASESRTSVIIATHNEKITKVCDRVLFLDKKHLKLCEKSGG